MSEDQTSYERTRRLEPEIEPLSDEATQRIKDSHFGDCFCPLFIPKRYVFVFVGFLASTLAIFLNVNLSLAIVAMVDRSNETITHARASNECLANQRQENFVTREELRLPRGEFHWSPQTEGLALGSVYYGQLVGFIPGGRLAELYGAKKVLIGFLLGASLMTSLLPVAARLSVYAFIACRFLVGVGTHSRALFFCLRIKK